MMEDQQLPKTNAEWANYYESIIAELTENQKKQVNQFQQMNFMNFL